MQMGEMDRVAWSLKLTQAERDRLGRLYGKMTDAERILVHARQTDIARANQELKTKLKRPEYYYLTFLLAVASAVADATAKLRVKPRRLTPPAKRPKKKKIKITKAQLWPWIYRQREDGYSWRNIARLLWQKYRIKIGERYLARLAAEVAAEKRLAEQADQNE